MLVLGGSLFTVFSGGFSCDGFFRGAYVFPTYTLTLQRSEFGRIGSLLLVVFAICFVAGTTKGVVM